MADILIVDDELDIRELIGDILEDEGFQTRRVGTAQACLDAISEQPPSLLILDIWLKDSDIDGIDILKKVKAEYPAIPVVIISGHGNIEIAVVAIKQGAYDFIEKPFNIDHLLVVIKRAFEASTLRHENTRLKQKDGPSFELVGTSANLKLLKLQLDKVAKSNGRVMLSGAFGSGREACARYIHAQSLRANRPFATFSCSLRPEDEIAEALFGRELENGTVNLGILEETEGGIVYLEDVGGLPLSCQQKLLKLLVEQKIVREGGKAAVPVDVRIISSTNQDLSQAILARKFREDLFSRLNVVPIEVPSLEERSEDIPELVNYFIDQFHAQEGYAKCELEEDAMTVIQTLSWPRNIYQLRNFVERLLILNDGGGRITKADVPTDTTPSQALQPSQPVFSNYSTMPLREARESFEREYLTAQIKRYSGNISKTAQFVGMERSALHRKLKSLGISTSSRGDE